MDWRLALGTALAAVVLAVVVYGLLLGAERYQAEQRAAATQSEEGRR